MLQNPFAFLIRLYLIAHGRMDDFPICMPLCDIINTQLTPKHPTIGSKLGCYFAVGQACLKFGEITRIVI
jgi:hypothetical protein